MGAEPTPADYGDPTYRDMAITAAEEHREAVQQAEQKDEALRDLLSHCRALSEHDNWRGEYAYEAYTDFAERLAKILDGEN